MTTPLVLELCI